MGLIVCKVKHKRCGRTSFNLSKGYCSACGFGKKSKIRKYSWQARNFRRLRIK